jgi:hypothetical protein
VFKRYSRLWLFRLSTLVRLSDFIDVNRTVTAFHTRRIIFQVCCADILHAIRLGAAMPAFDRGFVGNTHENVLQSIHFKETDMFIVSFDFTFLLSVRFNNFASHFILLVSWGSSPVGLMAVGHL